MNFTQYPAKRWDEVLPHIGSEARNLVADLVVYESKQRLTAAEVRLLPNNDKRDTDRPAQALQHAYFSTHP